MKYDITKPLTKGAKRTLEAFTGKMFMLLSEKSFEEITVGQLCEAAQYPRATFYNYFDDKYDLLGYCWQTLAEQVGFSDYHHAEENEMLYLYFDRIYDFTKQNEVVIHKVLLHNSEVGYMFSSFRNFLNSKMRFIFKTCPEATKKTYRMNYLLTIVAMLLFLGMAMDNYKKHELFEAQAHEWQNIDCTRLKGECEKAQFEKERPKSL